MDYVDEGMQERLSWYPIGIRECTNMPQKYHQYGDTLQSIEGEESLSTHSSIYIKSLCQTKI